MNNTDQIHETLLELGIATEEEISLVTSINGTNEESYNDILFSRTGYRSIEQMDILCADDPWADGIANNQTSFNTAP